jgi:eukaryotic-like serine/threonine-protein kinase
VTRDDDGPPQIPGYVYVGPLGTGGYSTVYRYHQLSLGRDVAVKVLRDRGQDGAAIAEALNEAKRMALLDDHPHIVRVYDAGTVADGQAFIAFIIMQLCRKETLAHLVEQGPLATARVVRLGRQIAGAVYAIHQAGLMHRDIKPANILVDGSGNPRLSDFGIAGTLARSAGDDTATPRSLPWCPPEILEGDPGSVHSDLYSLGATLWHLLAGRSPFDVPGDNGESDVIRRILETPASLTGRADVPVGLEQLLARMLAKRPDRRPVTADAVASELESIEKWDLRDVPFDGASWHPPHAPDTGVARAGHDIAEHEMTRVAAPGGPLPAAVPKAERTQTPQPEPGSGSRVEADWPTTIATPLPEHTADAPQQPRPVRDEPLTDPAPAPDSRQRWIWAAAGVLVAGAAVAALTLATTSSTPAADPAPSSGGEQGAGDGGDNLPPGVPTVTATRLDPKTLRFTWTYSAPLESDTFAWRTADGTRSDIADKPEIDLAASAGTELCVQVRVVRRDGSHASVEFSQPGCGS